LFSFGAGNQLLGAGAHFEPSLSENALERTPLLGNMAGSYLNSISSIDGSSTMNHLPNLGSLPLSGVASVSTGLLQSQQCLPYKGTLCSQFLLNQTVLTRGDLRLDQLLEHKLRQLIHLIATGKHISPHCHRYAIPALCFYAYPLCDANSMQVKPRQVSDFDFKARRHLQVGTILQVK
jgi:hypothetical protein